MFFFICLFVLVSQVYEAIDKFCCNKTATLFLLRFDEKCCQLTLSTRNANAKVCRRTLCTCKGFKRREEILEITC